MRIIECSDAGADAVPGAVVTIGNFDGIHRGHQAVLTTALDIARERGVPAGLLTFEPHPRMYFAPHNPMFRITPMQLKTRLAAALGFEFIAVLQFDLDLASLEPEDFVKRILVDRLSAAHVVVGTDFRFGQARAGDVTLLRSLGQTLGLEVSDVSPVGDPEADLPHFSSTSVRQALLHGNTRAAADILGYWWTVMGDVVKGDQIGHTIGFPTVNIVIEETSAPRLGIYAVRVRGADDRGREVWQGAGYVGRRPTFDKEEVVLEVFLFDFEGDLYGRTLMIEFIEFIRGDEKFDAVDALLRQMEQDCIEAKRLLDALESDGDPMRAFPLGAAQAAGKI